MTFPIRLLICSCLLLLAACGQSGALYRPVDKKQAVTPVAAPVAPAPTETAEPEEEKAEPKPAPAQP